MIHVQQWYLLYPYEYDTIQRSLEREHTIACDLLVRPLNVLTIAGTEPRASRAAVKLG